MPTINPYLGFNGNCEEAFEFYKSVFGGEYTMISRFKDVPAESGMQVSESEQDNIMHVGLPVGKENVLMGSDQPESMGKTEFGNNVSISVQVDSESEADKIFKDLSAGGKVTMPMTKAFWNAYFGMCTDKFGVHWMVNHDYGQK
jgi:PhnB protein